MELNVFVEDYIKKNHSQLPYKSQEDIRNAIIAGYQFSIGVNEPFDINSIAFILHIYHKAKKIHEAEDLDEREKYDLIFSEEISAKVSFDYYDPDTSYEEDVSAFMSGFKEYVENKQRLSKY